jgi:poly-gamma-glutamate synthesis protein (capsule biosynthesis protein)
MRNLVQPKTPLYFIVILIGLLIVRTVYHQIFPPSISKFPSRQSPPVSPSQMEDDPASTETGKSTSLFAPLLALPDQVPELTLDQIFTYHDPAAVVSLKDLPQVYVIMAAGDVSLARQVNINMISKNDFTYPFQPTGHIFKTADFSIVNLESPFVTNCPATSTGMIFCTGPRGIDGLLYAGIKAVNIANNHIGNYGKEGINTTLDLLNQNSIAAVGTQTPAIVTIKDKKFGLLGYDQIWPKLDQIAWAQSDRIVADIKNLKSNTDFVIVSFHWGEEYQLNQNTTQKQLAHAAIDAGADLIIGHHPHWVQGIEKYHQKFVVYSHGNFVFDQDWSRETTEGVIGRYQFNSQGLRSIEFFPVIITKTQPRYATPDEANRILSRMKSASFIENPQK